MTQSLRRFVRNESGATAIEYGLIAALVGVGLIVALGTLRGAISTSFDNAGTALTGAVSK